VSAWVAKTSAKADPAGHALGGANKLAGIDRRGPQSLLRFAVSAFTLSAYQLKAAIMAA
jgi:hypothetical protein